MRIETFSNRPWAFELTWIEADDDLDLAIAESFGEDNPGDGIIYITPKLRRKRRPGADVSGTRGFSRVSAKLKDAPASAAQALTLIGRDGLYVMRLAGGELWYCGIRDGAVVPGMDVIADNKTGGMELAGLAAGMELPIYADEPELVSDDEHFDVSDYLDHVKLRSMAVRGGQGKRVLFAGGIAVAGLVGFFLLHGPSNETGRALAQLRERQLNTYVNHMATAIGTLPVSSAWAMTAYTITRHVLPPFIAGWRLVEVVCDPKACQAKYEVAGTAGYALTPLKRRFEGHVRVVRAGKSLRVTVPLTASTEEITQAWLRARHRSSTPFADWLGQVPVVMAGGRVSGQPLNAPLSKRYNATNVGMPPLVLEKATIAGKNYLDRMTLAGIIHAGSVGGFRVLALRWTLGFQGEANWNMTWGRVHGS